MKSVLAIDLGATSGRAILYYISDNKLQSEEISRFENRPIKERGFLCWDVELLFSYILEAIRLANQRSDLQSVGIDTWGVDFALIDGNGQLISSPVHYRDSRTKGVLEEVAQCSSLSELYYKTGNQLMEINTLFQLLRTKSKTPDTYFKAETLLMIPDFFNYRLTGQKVVERSIASTMQMVNPFTKTWNQEILEMFEIPEQLLPDIVDEGRILGTVLEEHQVGTPKVITVCEHDTASAIAAIPTEDEHTLFISSGTWSLIGTELTFPIINDYSLNYNFTNEAGHSGTTTFLKNCTGLWIVEELRRNFELLGEDYSFGDITRMVIESTETVAIIDTDSPEFAEPGHMIEKIKSYAEKTSQPVPKTAGELFKIAYTSLACKYKEVIEQLEMVLGEKFKNIHLIGGGSKSEYFSQLIADITQKVVITGLSEATSMGNALIQLVALEELGSIKEARALIKNSIQFKHYYPK
ncbi:rhamnulokinase [Streptococcus suis]